MFRRLGIRSVLAVLAALLAFLTISPAARAATVLALDLPALVTQSDYIVIANAQADSSRHRADGLIVTDVELKVIESLKGDAKPSGTLVATVLGGEVDGIGLSVPGEATFEIGRGAIVFLRRAPKVKELRVVGMSQGVLAIDGSGQSARVLPANGAELLQRTGDGKLVPASGALTEPRALRDVIARIAQLVSDTHAR